MDVDPPVGPVVLLGLPVWTPIRTKTAPPAGQSCSANAAWAAATVSKARRALAKATKNASASVLTSTP